MPNSPSVRKLSHAGKQASKDSAIPIVPVEKCMSPEDKLILYAVLQDIADELRSLDHDQKKDQKHTEKRTKESTLSEPRIPQ